MRILRLLQRMPFGIVLFLLVMRLQPLSAFGRMSFFVEANPSLSWTSAEPLASVDASLLDPDDYARYYAMPSLLNFGLEMEQGGVGLVFRIDIRPDFLSFLTSPYNTNIPLIQNPLIAAIGDANMPSVAYIDYVGNNLTLSAGRRQLKWGQASYSLAISDSASYMDHLWLDYRFRTKKGAWWYNFVVIGADRAGQTWEDLGASRIGYKTIFAHRAGFESDALRIAVGELNLVHDIAPSLLDMAPLASFHNLYEDIYSNVLLSATAEFKVEDFRGFGEFVMDDLIMSWESWLGRPTALGWNYGLEYRLLPGPAYKPGEIGEAAYALKEETFREPGGLTLGYEHYRTTTYLYNRENISGKWTLPDHRLVNDSSGYIDSGEAFYLGFAYGPDVCLDMVTVSWEAKSARVSLALKYLQKGSYGIKSPYPPADGESTWYTLQEPVSRNFVAGVSGAWAASPNLQVWADGELSLGDEPQGRVSAGCSYRFKTK